MPVTGGGTRIIGGYEIEGELGRGGMGVVFRAWQRKLNRQELEAATKSPASASYGALRLHPYWDPPRGDSRFEKIAAGFAPK